MAIGLAPLVRIILCMLTLAPGSAEQVVIETGVRLESMLLDNSAFYVSFE